MNEHGFDKDFLMQEAFDGDKPESKHVEIESRKDKDVWFDSLAGWNADDKLGNKKQALERKLRKKDEVTVRLALKKQRQAVKRLATVAVDLKKMEKRGPKEDESDQDD